MYRLLRNMPHFDGASGSEPNAADSSYNALQVKWEKRFSRGLQILAHYTWATSQGSQLQNPLDFRLEKSLSANDVSQRFAATGVYEVPFGRGRRYAADANRLLDGVVGGWQISGIFTLQAAQPLIVQQNGGTLWNGTQRPNLIGNPATTGSVYNRFGKWFDTAAFTQPAPDTFGTAPAF